MTDLAIISGLSSRFRYEALGKEVPKGLVSADTTRMLMWYGLYYQANPEHTEVDFDVLEGLIKARTPDNKPDQLSLDLALLAKARQPVRQEVVDSLISTLHEMKLAGRAAAVITEYQAGGEVDLVLELDTLVRDTAKACGSGTASSFIEDSALDIAKEILDERGGLHFTFSEPLRAGLLGLRGGHSVLVAGQVDKGKTTLLLNMAVDFAKQLNAGNLDRPILFLVNEGDAKRFKPRLYQIALGATLPEVVALGQSGELEKKYNKVLGSPDRIKLKNVHGAGVSDIVGLMEKTNAAVLFLDMVANVRPALKDGSKTDCLEHTWQQLREAAVRNDCIVIGSAQISVEGHDVLYPPLSAIKDSRVGAQGAVDLAILMGSATGAPNLRGLHVAKNKLYRTGHPVAIQTEIMFTPDTARFLDGVNP